MSRPHDKEHVQQDLHAEEEGGHRESRSALFRPGNAQSQGKGSEQDEADEATSRATARGMATGRQQHAGRADDRAAEQARRPAERIRGADIGAHY
jgi:hypothetical protein